MITIRKENRNDYYEVEKVIREAFWNVYMEGAEEHLLVHKLRNDASYLENLSRIAVDNGKIIGAIFYSKALLIDEKNNSYPIITFGPLGVLPKYQKTGVGKKLLEETIKIAIKEKYNAIVITGVPTYYPKFGFKDCFELNLYMPGDIQFPALMGYEIKKDFIKKLNKSYFIEAEVYEARASKKELDEYDVLFPYLEKVKKPTQFKKPNI